MLYKLKGYSDAWIKKRMRGIEVGETLTDEWKKRGIKKDMEYSILTAEIKLNWENNFALIQNPAII